MSTPQEKRAYLLPFALILLAGSITYLAFQIQQFIAQLPQIEKTLTAYEPHIPSIVEEVAQVRQTVPMLVDEIAKVRSTVEKVEQQIPLILATVDTTTQVMDTQLNKTLPLIPDIIDTANKTSVSINNASAAVKELTPAVPSIISTVNATTEQIDRTTRQIAVSTNAIAPALDRAELIVASAKEIGAETGEGAVTGFFKGILKSPVTLIEGIASPIVNGLSPEIQRQLTKDDAIAMQNTLDDLWASNKSSVTGQWRNSKTGSFGTIELTNRRSIDQQLCYDAEMSINVKGSRRTKNTNVNTLCQTSDGSYKLR